MIGTLKRRAECASDEMVRRERDRSTGLEAALAERRRAEESLRALFDRNLAGMFRSRRDGRVLECNAAFVRLLGYRSREEVLACNAKEFYLDAKDRERLLRLLRPGAVVTNEELQLRRADGIPLWGARAPARGRRRALDIPGGHHHRHHRPEDRRAGRPHRAPRGGPAVSAHHRRGAP